MPRILARASVVTAGPRRRRPSTSYKERTFVQAPRCCSHNSIEFQMVKKLWKHHPGENVTSDRLITDRDGVRLRPGIVPQGGWNRST
ncbi:hypothetical protein HPB48_026342 [Haemaphysalis longicornis]|uniref:Uncharacterized protein n=1 Tax=Haemaphysalis longicornis TaxID=44386 RepID=A0A9J6HAI4_HAELO|nr:hypothetical protein HPB48_026342 [Haemaphysalis longicornis]